MEPLIPSDFDFILSDSEESLESLYTERKPRRKRIRKRKPWINPLKQMVRNDIRRCYATMFVNILNSSDFPLMFGFLSTFMIPSAQYTASCRDSIGGNIHNLSVCGTYEVAQQYCTTMALSPDAIFSLRDCRVDFRNNIVRAEVEYCATYFYKHSQIWFDEQTRKKRCAKLTNDVHSTVPNDVMIEQIMRNVGSFVYNLERRPDPDSIVAKTIVMIHMDPEKRIVGVELLTEY